MNTNITSTILAVYMLAWTAHASANNGEDAKENIPTVEVRAAAPVIKSLLGIPQTSLNTPFSLSIVDMATLNDQGGTSLLDALRNVPGAQADLSFTGSHSQVFVLRGSLADSGTGASRVLRDGARLSNYPFVPAFVESVQVLRGPGAAVGTRSEPGGTVQLVTKQAQTGNFGTVIAGIGRYGAKEASVDLNRVLSSDHELAGRIIVVQSEASEWRNVPDQLDGIKLALTQGHGDSYHLRAGVELTNQRYKPDFGVPAIDGRPAAIPVSRQLSEPWDTSSTRNRVLDLHADVALSEQARWNFDATHLDADSTSIRQSVWTRQAGSAGIFARVVAIEPGTTRKIDSIATSVSGNVQAGNLKHKLYAGVEYYKEVLAQPSGSASTVNSPSIDIFNPIYGRVTSPSSFTTTLTRENLESSIATIQDQVDWSTWSAIAGVQFMQQKFFYGTTGSAVAEQRWSPKLAVLKRWLPQQTLYATFSTGSAPNQAASATNVSLPSRTSRQFELGWKSGWFNGALNTEAALFWLDQNHMLADDPSTAYIYDKKVTGQARAKGMELSANGQLTTRLSVEAAYAYTDSRYLRDVEFAGKFMPNVAKQTLSLFGHYDWSDSWRSGLGLYAQGQRFADEANTTIMPGYGRLDATHRYRQKLGNGQSIEIQLSMRNLLNKQYYAASHLHVTRYILPGETRSAMLTATYHF